jgi:hypothetical protein
MTDIDAIRARDEHGDPDVDGFDRHALLAEVDRLTAERDEAQMEYGDCCLEGDRLRAEVARLMNLHDDKSCSGCLAADAEVARLEHENEVLDAANKGLMEWGAEEERARIIALLRGMHDTVLAPKNARRSGWNSALNSALAYIEPETFCQHRVWLTMDPPVCAGCGKVGER